ncbi:glycosyltransferase [Nocardioides sp. TRM66260-LWL]|uniref:glycosyltransferase n=1 Tax=Nocardioides sp. TRM66260-LWL TaxID=2874478 RepID=UPI001CC7BB99|nr:glycosyltransferase [Nocardioides sp. TRM66260-LWL]MBZ5734906.1 glycosyltransferase [Nocardioides sp. TRM66260-LWL]
MTPVISVVIPCLNGAATLARQLDALVTQECDHPWEVIVADNGSTDATARIVREYADRGVRLVDASERAGSNHARNRGVEAARGSLILHCDADDQVRPGWMQAFADALLAGADWVGGTLRHVATDGRLLREVSELPRSGFAGARYALGANCGYHRALWQEVGGFDDALSAGCDEVDFFIRLAQSGATGVLVPEAVVDYVQRDGLRALLRQQRSYGHGFARMRVKHGAVADHPWVVQRSSLGMAIARQVLAFVRALRRLPLLIAGRTTAEEIVRSLGFEWGLAEQERRMGWARLRLGSRGARRPARVLVTSHSFAPAIGGIESVAEELARGLVAAGHEVVVVTATPGGDVDGLRVVRGPGPLALLRLAWRSDAVLQVNVSLRTLWAPLLLRRRVVCVVATWLRRADGSVGRPERLKRAALRRTRVVAPSAAVAAHLGLPAAVVPHAVRVERFAVPADAAPEPRDGDVVVVGRLVSDKGVGDLVDAVAELGRRGRPVGLTVVGDGPERAALQRQAEGLDGVRFHGVARGPELAGLLQRHRVIAVPSRWDEPFGLVALEGLAAGCLPVVSTGGGLPEAAGPDAVVFPNGDVAALADALVVALERAAGPGWPTAASAEHLAAHAPEVELRAHLRLLGLADLRDAERLRSSSAPGTRAPHTTPQEHR